MDQLNMTNRFKQFLPQGQTRPPMNEQVPNRPQPAQPQAAQVNPHRQGHPMAQMLAQGNPALQNKESAIPVLQPPGNSVMPQMPQMPQMPHLDQMRQQMGQMVQQMPQGAQQAMQNIPQLPQAPQGEAANPHQAFIQSALQQGLPQEMIMQFLSSKLNLK